MHTCINININSYVCICLFESIHTYIHACTYRHMCMYIYIYNYATPRLKIHLLVVLMPHDLTPGPEDDGSNSGFRVGDLGQDAPHNLWNSSPPSPSWL